MSKLLFYKCGCVACLCLPVSLPVSAQEADSLRLQALPQVEVVAKERPSVLNQGAPVQRLERTGFQALGLKDVSEAVRRFSGVTVNDYGGLGGLKTVSVRSLGAKHTAVSYDGLPVTDAQSGQVDISRYSLDDLQALSLSIGPSDNLFLPASLYASSGALALTSVAPQFTGRDWHLRAKLQGGSFGLFHPFLRYDRKIDRSLALSATAEGQSAKGNYPFLLYNGGQSERLHRTNSDIQLLHLEGNLYGRFGGGRQLRLKLYTYNADRGLPGSVVLYNAAKHDRLRNDNFFVQAVWQQPLSPKFEWEARGKYDYSFSHYRTPNASYAAGEQIDINTQQEAYASASLLYKLLPKLSASLASDLFYITLRNNFTGGPQPDRLSSYSALALQYKDSRLTATARLLGTYLSDRVHSGNRPPDRHRLSPALSFSLRPFPASSLRLRASYKDAYRAPTFTDLYYLRFGNLNLRPERAAQFDLGLTGNWALSGVLTYLAASADAYYNRVRDKIVALPNLYVWKMMNMGKVDIRGLDLNLSGLFRLPSAPRFSLEAAATYSYQRAIDLSEPTAKNYRQQIPYTPRHAGTASCSLHSPWATLGYLLTAVGERYALPQNIAENRMGAYAEQSLSLGRDFRFRSWRLHLQGEWVNFTNRQYEVIQYYPMPGSSFRISLSMER
ncbi:MAG: TonB-dependent receptor [Tannerella sp.]|jgi:outer membrane receptor protein involved in Fe transport|nr:TonB-dependent receptor [Tannerella sp.]